jgi:hypothetical protein
MRGTNSWYGSGNVGASIRYARTRESVECCSFVLAIDDRNTTTRVRVNVYGGLVEICRKKLRSGKYAIIHGELMNRLGVSKGEIILETRARNIIFVPKCDERILNNITIEVLRERFPDLYRDLFNEIVNRIEANKKGVLDNDFGDTEV